MISIWNNVKYYTRELISMLYNFALYLQNAFVAGYALACANPMIATAIGSMLLLGCIYYFGFKQPYEQKKQRQDAMTAQKITNLDKKSEEHSQKVRKLQTKTGKLNQQKAKLQAQVNNQKTKIADLTETVKIMSLQQSLLTQQIVENVTENLPVYSISTKDAFGLLQNSCVDNLETPKNVKLHALNRCLDNLAKPAIAPCLNPAIMYAFIAKISEHYSIDSSVEIATRSLGEEVIVAYISGNEQLASRVLNNSTAENIPFSGDTHNLLESKKPLGTETLSYVLNLASSLLTNFRIIDQGSADKDQLNTALDAQDIKNTNQLLSLCAQKLEFALRRASSALEQEQRISPKTAGEIKSMCLACLSECNPKTDDFKTKTSVFTFKEAPNVADETTELSEESLNESFNSTNEDNDRRYLGEAIIDTGRKQNNIHSPSVLKCGTDEVMHPLIAVLHKIEQGDIQPTTGPN